MATIKYCINFVRGSGYLRSLACLFLLLTSSSGVFAQTLKVMPLGNSITEGRGSCSYRTPLVQSLGSCDFEMVGSKLVGGIDSPDTCITTNSDHEGHSGWTTQNFLADNGGQSFLEGYVSAKNPDVVLLHIGSNDMFRSFWVGTYDVSTGTGAGTIGRIDEMIDQIYAEQPNATVLVGNMVPWLADSTIDSEMDLLRIEITIMVNDRKSDGDAIELVDVNTGFTASMMQDDMIHPNAAGDSHLAARFKSVMQANDFCAPVPGMPQVIAPVADAIIEMNTGIEFSWQEVDFATSYDFFIWDRTIPGRVNEVQDIPASSICQSGVCQLQSSVILPEHPNHKWSVRAGNGSGKSDYSSTTFGVLLLPDAPTIVSPQAGAVLQGNTGFDFIWDEVANATHYDFYIWDRTIPGRVNEISGVPSGDICNGATCTLTSTVVLNEHPNHKWYIRATNASGQSSYSQAQFAVEAAVVVPDVPEIISPQSGATLVVNTGISFSWVEDSNATHYDFYIWDRTIPSRVNEINGVPSGDVCSGGNCSIISTTVLNDHPNHKWYVRASNSAGSSGYAQAQFGVEAAVVPDAPVVISPADGESVPENTLHPFSWNEVSGATHYDFYIWDRTIPGRSSENYSVPASSICSAGTCVITENTRPAHPNHKWLVRASNSAGESGYTSTRYESVESEM